MTSIKTVYSAETDGGTVTQFIPLTSVFTYPLACSKSLLLEGNTLEAFDPKYDGLISTMSCVPPAVLSSAFAPNQEMLVPTILNLGPFTCPRSWSTLSTSTKDQTSTFAICCPPGYNTLTGAFCLSDITKNEVLTFASGSERTGTSSWEIVTSTAGESFQIVASAMQGWNIARSTASPTSSHTSPNSPSASPTSSTSSTSPTGIPTKDAASKGLSTGAKAAIGVCVPVAVLLIIALLAVFVIRHRKRASAAKAAVGGTPDPNKAESQPYGQKAELPGEGKQTGELPGHEAAEIGGLQKPVAELEMPIGGELAADQMVHELPATPATQELPH